MKKVIFLLLVALGLFFWYPSTGGYPDQNKETKPPQQTELQPNTSEEESRAVNFLLTVLPPKDEWPLPIQKLYFVFNVDQAIHNKHQNLDWVPISEIPLEMQQALIAIEDHNFYNHGAIDIDGVLRAMLVNITAGEVVQGGSTITQQLTKNLFLSPEQTMERKIEEAILALIMEQRYNKEQLLEIYFNTTYFGAGATGIHAAADTYFGKTPMQMNLSECAILAALPYAPSALNPYENPEGCKKRQLLVLQRMVKWDYIDSTTAEKAQLELVELSSGGML